MFKAIYYKCFIDLSGFPEVNVQQGLYQFFLLIDYRFGDV
jgi:hypothetical protein